MVLTAEIILQGRGLDKGLIGLAKLLYHPKPDMRISAIPFLLERCVKLGRLSFPELMRAILQEKDAIGELAVDLRRGLSGETLVEGAPAPRRAQLADARHGATDMAEGVHDEGLPEEAGADRRMPMTLFQALHFIGQMTE